MSDTAEFYDQWCSRGGKDLVRNLQMRNQLLEQAKESVPFQEELKMMFKRDILFFFNASCWIYEPRKRKLLPFITYPFQDEYVLELKRTIGRCDAYTEKSRDMGASWIALLVIEHEWQFFENGSYALYSYKEDLVDKSGDPDALMWKIDHVLKNQPEWLRPNYKRTSLHFENLDLLGTIDGAGITENTTVGGRKTVIFFDEAPKVTKGNFIFKNARDSTLTRWFTGTANGTGNKAYEIVRQARAQKDEFLESGAEPAIQLFTLHWTRHPEKNKGLYYTDTGKPRSIAYDRELARCGDPREMAQEWDIDYAAAGYQFFDPAKLEEQIAANCRQPDCSGNFKYDEKGFPAGIDWDEAGLFQLWFVLDEDGKPPRGEYSVGADVSVGTGASNSTLSVTDKKTGRKVCAYANPRIPDYEFARLAVAVCRWFYDAFLIWEQNGPGRSFGNEVLKLEYPNIFFELVNEKNRQNNYFP